MNGRAINLFLTLGSILFALGLVEGALRVLAPGNPGPATQRAFEGYSAQELEVEEGPYTAQTGGECLAVGSNSWWHPHFSWNTVKLNPICARMFFTGDHRSLVFLGGSVMANAFSPNHFTTIDEAVHKNLHGNWRSLNLAESGARSTNEMIRFLLEVTTLKPDVVVFLDGYNEFSAIQYSGGKPNEDFYWAANVKSKVHAPLHNMFERLIDKSILLEYVLVRTGIVSSPRIAQAPSEDMIIDAAEFYLENITKTEKLCRAYQIRCIFFLQPTLYHKQYKTVGEIGMLDRSTKTFPGVRTTIERGYQHIREHSKVPIIDLTGSIDVQNHVYIDLVHLNKVGNRLIGERMAESINELYAIRSQ